MPKPVLSDSLFNADNVATAVLQEANLQISNSNLGVTDRTSLFTASNSYVISANEGGGAYSFNGFMFINFRLDRSGGAFNGECITISDSNFYPTKTFTFPTISHEGDRANYVSFGSNGSVTMHLPSDQGGSTFHAVINGFYRYA